MKPLVTKGVVQPSIISEFIFSPDLMLAKVSRVYYTTSWMVFITLHADIDFKVQITQLYNLLCAKHTIPCLQSRDKMFDKLII